METLVVIPAYGRDYASEAEAVQAWESGFDFEIANAGVRGKYVSCRSDLAGAGFQQVEIRYAAKRELAIIKLGE